jgi:hypothetical protein
MQGLGVDLRDLWRDDTQLTPRYVLMLVEHLPDSSAIASSHRGGREHRPWTFETHLLAATVNLLYAANRQRAKKSTPKPLITAPKRKTKARRITVAQILAANPDARA